MYPVGMAPDPIAPRHLRSALEFAVLMAREGQKFKPPMKSPKTLGKYIKMTRIPTGSLAALRRIVEADETFRQRIAVGALPELVDEIGRVWLTRPDGWQATLTDLVAEVENDEAEASAAKELKRANKRKAAAEQVAARARAEIVVLTEQVADRDRVIEGLRSDIVKLADDIEALRSELIDSRNDTRHARDRERAALAKLERAESARVRAQAAQGAAEGVRDGVLADRAAVLAERSELTRLAATAEALAAQLAAVATPVADGQPRQPPTRQALPMPGGVLGDSDTATEYLLRSGASILVDGYNVAKQAWPRLDLPGQRVVLLDALENLARRFGSDITVVFDGADVVGATGRGRHLVRVVFSPDDMIADDLLREEVQRLPASRQVVVVTNDREIVRDVRAMGANTMSSDQLIAVMHR